MLSRRDLLKLGLASGAVAATPRWVRAAGDEPGRWLTKTVPSPRVRPFSTELPLPPVLRPVPAFATARAVPPGTLFYELQARAVLHRFHPDLPASPVWGYEGVGTAGNLFSPGPTLVTQLGRPVLVRLSNRLPADHRGFGVPNLAMHRHGGFQSSEDDGYPLDFVRPGEFRDYLYTGIPEDSPRESQGTLWYHDHLVDFTAQNVYRGLAGFNVQFSARDTGDETDASADALRLPSGPYDIAMVLQDRQFDRDGMLVYNPVDHDGFLGDTMVVNGAVQPFLRVRRRKYRFRFLNGANARFFELALSNGQPMVQVATEGGMLDAPLPRRSILLGMAERAEVVVDFSAYPNGTGIFLENRMEQTDGRGPKQVLRTGTPLVQFRVDGTAPDPSRVPARLREAPTPDTAPIAARRSFEFNRSNGAWTVNGELWDENRVVARPRLEEPEIWTLRNSSGGWWHPIHVHLALFEVVSRNGRTPPPWERAKKDTVVLGPSEEVQIKIKFRQFRGRYVFHCHNIEHEDMAMMARFDTE